MSCCWLPWSCDCNKGPLIRKWKTVCFVRNCAKNAGGYKLWSHPHLTSGWPTKQESVVRWYFPATPRSNFHNVYERRGRAPMPTESDIGGHSFFCDYSCACAGTKGIRKMAWWGWLQRPLAASSMDGVEWRDSCAVAGNPSRGQMLRYGWYLA